jgi:hypothetical protein
VFCTSVVCGHTPTYVWDGEEQREGCSYRMRSEGSIYMSGVSGAFQISGFTWNDDMVEHSGSY